MGRGNGAANYPRALLVALVGVLCLSLVFAGATSATAFGAYNGKWNGATQLQTIAQSQNAPVTVLTEVSEYQNADPNGTVAVVLAPEEPYRPDERAVLRRFVRNGGTLLVAEDYGPHTNELLATTGASTRVDGRPLRDERRYYKSPAFPVAEGNTDRPTTADVDQFTLNHGTALTTASGAPVTAEATVLVNSSEFSYIDADRDGTLDESETLKRRPVVAVEPVADGRVIVVSDPSAFINAMLERPGNQRFISNVFESHDRVLLDYSHVAGQPPLMAAALALRKSGPLSALVGLLGLLAVAAVGNASITRTRIVTAVGRFDPRRSSRSSEGQSPPRMDTQSLTAHLRNRHPDWEEDRIERVIAGVIARRTGGDGNE